MQPRLTQFAIVAIALQCLAIFLVNTRISFFSGDDLNAVALMQQVDFWSFIATPVDIHRIPLHRLVNYLLHTLFPMNFAAATIFMLGCHAASLFVLYRLLQRLNPSRLNLWLILAYAFSGYVYIVMHWWSAGLHRLPYILSAIVSCYSFWRFHQQRQASFAVLAIASQVVAVGFFVKAVLIPAYWAAMLFCCMDFRAWRKYSRDYLLIASGMMLSLAYVGWYMYGNPYDLIQSTATGLILRTSLQLGFSTIAQMPLQMRLHTDVAPWINLAYGLLLSVTVFFAPRTWRAILMAFLALAINLLIIAGSSRATLFGALAMLITYYYTELLFLMAIFATLLWQRLREKIPDHQFNTYALPAAWRNHLIAPAAITVCLLYATAGWRTAWIAARPGPDEDHWKTARFVRNLRHDADAVDINKLNLIDRLVPDYLRFGMLYSLPLPTSQFLSWFGWHPQFQQPDKPLGFIDTRGHIQTVDPKSAPVTLHTASGQPSAGCVSDADTSKDLFFLTPQPLALDHGYLQIDYEALHDTSATAQLQANNPGLRPFTINFAAGRKRILIDISHFWQFVPIEMTGVHLVQSDANMCVHGIDITPY